MYRIVRQIRKHPWKSFWIAAYLTAALAVYWFLPNEPRRLWNADILQGEDFLAFGNNGEKFFTSKIVPSPVDGGQTVEMVIRELQSGRVERTLPLFAANIRNALISSNGSVLRFQEQHGEVFRHHLFSILEGRTVETIDLPAKANDHLFSSRLVPSGDFALLATHTPFEVSRKLRNDSLPQLEWIEHRFRVRVKALGGSATSLDLTGIIPWGQFSPDGTRYAVVEVNPSEQHNKWGKTSIHIHDSASGQRLATCEPFDGAFAGMRHSPDGSIIAFWSLGTTDTLRFVDAVTGRLLHQLDGTRDFGRFLDNGGSVVLHAKVDGKFRPLVLDTRNWNHRILEEGTDHGPYYVSGSQPQPEAAGLPDHGVVHLYRFKQTPEGGFSALLQKVGLRRRQDRDIEIHRFMDVGSGEILATFEPAGSCKVSPDGRSAFVLCYELDREGFSEAMWDIRPHRPWGRIAAIWGLMIVCSLFIRVIVKRLPRTRRGS